jgi:hypothetical protein
MLGTTLQILEAQWAPIVGERRFDDGNEGCVEVAARVMSLPRQPPLAQKPAQDSSDRREAGVGGLSARKRASDSLKPSVGHLAAKPRYAPIGDRTRMRRTARPSLCELRRAGREPTKHPLSAGRQRSDAVLHGLIVLTAETIVPPPMHQTACVSKPRRSLRGASAQLRHLKVTDQANLFMRDIVAGAVATISWHA